MSGVHVAGFLPSTCGFRFANRFLSQPALVFRLPGGRKIALGDAANGLCGGMVFAVRDFFECGRMPPRHVTFPPIQGTPLFEYLVRRLFASFCLPWGPSKYYAWMLRPDRDRTLVSGVRRLSLHREWPKIQAALDGNRLACLGLVRVRSFDVRQLRLNHQVLAYGYEKQKGGSVYKIRIYDPNYTGCDDIVLSWRVAANPNDSSIFYSTGEPIRGFFHTPYVPAQIPSELIEHWPEA